MSPNQIQTRQDREGTYFLKYINKHQNKNQYKMKNSFFFIYHLVTIIDYLETQINN